MSGKQLFLLTKTFPFGNAEQYIRQEMPYLSRAFEKIYIVPCSIFGTPPELRQELPANAEVFLINNNIPKSKSIGKRWSHFRFVSKQVSAGRKSERDLAHFEATLPQAKAIMQQQLACADALDEFMNAKQVDRKAAVFYSYWVHSSAIILGILKAQGKIDSFVTRAHSYDLYHQDFFREKTEKSPLPWEWFKFSSADRVYCISEHGANHLRRKYPEMKAKFEVQYLGVNNAEELNPEARTDKFRIVTCSTIQPLKRLTLIPEIMTRVTVPVEWIHFGSGEQKYIDELTEASCKFERPGNRIELRGFVKNQDVHKYYATNHIDLFLNLSLAEGVPVSLMEAAAHGIPLMATDVYGSAEVARPGCGFLLNKDVDVVAAAEMISRFAGDAKAQASARENARRVQREWFDAHRNFTSFVNELINPSWKKVR